MIDKSNWIDLNPSHPITDEPSNVPTFAQAGLHTVVLGDRLSWPQFVENMISAGLHRDINYRHIDQHSFKRNGHMVTQLCYEVYRH